MAIRSEPESHKFQRSETIFYHRPGKPKSRPGPAMGGIHIPDSEKDLEQGLAAFKSVGKKLGVI